MKFTTYFFDSPNGTEGLPTLCSSATGEFEGFRDAVMAAKSAAKLRGAHSFVAEDEAGDTEEWISNGDGWRRGNAKRP